MAGVVDKVKAKVEHALHKDKTHSDPTGPHDTHTANKADPRVDSDHVGGIGNTGSAAYGTHGTTGGLTGNTHTTGSGLTGNNYGSDPTGPHGSHLANKADPRVDSSTAGGYGNTTGQTHGLTGTAGGHSSGLTGNNYGSDPTGPHDSKMANKLDPRVDSSTAGPHGNTAGARTGTYGSDPTGPHDSHLGNKADPRVDSSRTGGYGNTTSTGGYGSAGPGGSGITSGPGPAPDTAGPHKSNVMNKADPRVDSDLDGSKTFGGNKTSGY